MAKQSRTALTTPSKGSAKVWAQQATVAKAARESAQQMRKGKPTSFRAGVGLSAR